MLHSYNTQDTICALSTPPGTGAIAVIRISGEAAFGVCSSVFKPSEKTFSWEEVASNTVHFGHFADSEELVDEVLVTLFRNPHSYTGEDVIEISCHGSVYIQNRILQLLTEKGLRLASPGEFTLRAFLNGKFDLSQAEAVADLIASHSRTSHDLAINQIRGGFSKKIRELRQQLLDFSSLVELELDFSGEDVEFAARPELMKLLDVLQSTIETLVKSFSLGNVIRTGIPVAIIGKPNTGKSTLLNSILDEERAIVSEIPGTTRDTVEDTIVIGGYSFRFIDTAGLRKARGKIENIGIGKTYEKIREAAVILYVFDASQDSYNDVATAISELKDITEDQKTHIILVGNKTDLLEELPHGFRDFSEHETIFVSAKRSENIHLIAESLVRTVSSVRAADNAVISNARHYEALQKTLESIESVREGIQKAIPSDLISVDIRKALYHLGEITGEITSDEILGNIFGKFCIGK